MHSYIDPGCHVIPDGLLEKLEITVLLGGYYSDSCNLPDLVSIGYPGVIVIGGSVEQVTPVVSMQKEDAWHRT